MNKRATVALVVGLLCVDSVNAQQSTMEQLQAADNIRTSNRPQFSDLLSQLQPARPEMSNAEQDYLDFLLAFRDTLEGRHEEAITTLQRLVVSHGALASPWLKPKCCVGNTSKHLPSWRKVLPG